MVAGAPDLGPPPLTTATHPSHSTRPMGVMGANASRNHRTSQGRSDPTAPEGSAANPIDLDPPLPPRRGRPVRGLPVGLPMLVSLLFMTLVTPVEPVTCFTCYDGIPGCTGGANCPFLTLTASNRDIMAGTVANGAPTSLSCANLLPLRHLRILSRTALDVLKVVARRPIAGTPVDMTVLDPEGLIRAVNAGSIYLAEALRDVARRMAIATTQIELTRLNALQATLSSIERVGATMGGAGASSSAGVLLGALTFAYYKATAIVRADGSTTVTGVVTEDTNGMGDDERRLSSALITARIHLPRSLTEFMNAIMVWIMIASATGLAHVLTMGNFIQDTVFDTMSKLKRPWQVAHELFLIYLEKIEICEDRSLTLANVFNSGAQDTLLARAEEKAKVTFGDGIFRPVRERDGRPPEDGGGKPEWTGSFNRDPTARPCISFNLGRKQHPPSALNDKGGCRFNHVCDAWVVKDGKRQICGSTKHCRVNCDNPNREAKEAA